MGRPRWESGAADVLVSVSSLFLPFPPFSSLFLSFLLALPSPSPTHYQAFDFFFPNLHLRAAWSDDVLLHTVVSNSGVFPNSH